MTAKPAQRTARRAKPVAARITRSRTAAAKASEKRLLDATLALGQQRAAQHGELLARMDAIHRRISDATASIGALITGQDRIEGRLKALEFVPVETANPSGAVPPEKPAKCPHPFEHLRYMGSGPLPATNPDCRWNYTCGLCGDWLKFARPVTIGGSADLKPTMVIPAGAPVTADVDRFKLREAQRA